MPAVRLLTPDTNGSRRKGVFFYACHFVTLLTKLEHETNSEMIVVRFMHFQIIKKVTVAWLC